jgi:hypothetical protein
VYNLSGGTMNTGVIRKNHQSTSVGVGLNDTGGTITIRNNMYRTGSWDGTRVTWTQGASTLEVGGSIGVVNIGVSNYEQRHTTTDGSIIRIELASDASYDYGRASDNANFTDGTLNIVALGSYVPAYNTTFDIWKTDLKAGKSGTGTFDQITDNLAGYFTAAWVNGVGASDTLRITYVPEPATICLLGLGLLAIRRRRS